MDWSTVTSVSAIASVVLKTRIMEKYVEAQVGLTRGVTSTQFIVIQWNLEVKEGQWTSKNGSL